jgi:hypothetical protein
MNPIHTVYKYIYTHFSHNYQVLKCPSKLQNYKGKYQLEDQSVDEEIKIKYILEKQSHPCLRKKT